jgi:hypothetical protein
MDVRSNVCDIPITQSDGPAAFVYLRVIQKPKREEAET